jgi:8-amino-7-oxononanoate synthase
MRLGDELRSALERATGVRPTGSGPIVPWVLGSAERATLASQQLLALGIGVLPIRPPTVPVGTARLRFVVHAGIPPEVWRSTLDSIERVAAAL